MELLSEEYREKGNACMKEDKFIEAMFHYTHGIKIEPNNAYLFSNRSLAFLRMQQYYHALEDAKTTIQMMPKWPKGYYRKAEIETAAEHYKEAIESYKQGLILKPDDPGLKEGLAKAMNLWQAQRRHENWLPWYGLALGSLVAILLILGDETVTKKPVLQNDVLRAVILVCVAGVGCLFAFLYRLFVRSQRSSLLEEPPDLLGDGLLDTPSPTPGPAGSSAASSPEAHPMTRASPASRTVNQRKKGRRS